MKLIAIIAATAIGALALPSLASASTGCANYINAYQVRVTGHATCKQARRAMAELYRYGFNYGNVLHEVPAWRIRIRTTRFGTSMRGTRDDGRGGFTAQLSAG
jgi:hypothetical protein